jgi:hypothetical protein
VTHNIHIPLEHQSAPNFKYDAGLAREAATAEQKRDRDWDKFDREMDAPEHHDLNIEILKQRAHVQKLTYQPEEWVEENLEIYAANVAKAKDQRLEGQERWEGEEQEKMRFVNLLHPSAVMRRLRMAGVDARDYESPHARIWLNDWTTAGLVGVNAWVAPQEMDEQGYLVELADARSQAVKDLITENYLACRDRRKVRKTITSLQEPYGPEWSIMRFDDHGIATKEKYRGWRTAMLVLIAAEILTEDEVDRAFGPPLGEAGAWYRQTLQSYRQIKLGRSL